MPKSSSLSLIEDFGRLTDLLGDVEDLGPLTLTHFEFTPEMSGHHLARRVIAGFALAQQVGKPKLSFGLNWIEASHVSISAYLGESTTCELILASGNGFIETQLLFEGKASGSIVAERVVLSYVLDQGAPEPLFRREDEVWGRIPGAEGVKARLGFYPTFHDATLISALMESEGGEASLRLRLELNEGGPMDKVSLQFRDVTLFDVEGWNCGGEIEFSSSEITQLAEGIELALTGAYGNWRIRAKGLSIVDHEYEGA